MASDGINKKEDDVEVPSEVFQLHPGAIVGGQRDGVTLLAYPRGLPGDEILGSANECHEEV